MAVRLFLARRKQFASVLESSKSAISTSRFIRLIALSATQIAFTLPILLFIRIFSLVNVPLLPYVSWDYVHADFGGILHLPIKYLEANSTKASTAVLELGYWLYPVSSALFFVFFGLGAESVSSYREWTRSVRSALCRGKAKGSMQGS